MFKLRKANVIRCAEDDELLVIIEKMGLMNKLQAGKLQCWVCGKTISRGTIGAITQVSGSLKLACDKSKCVAVMSHRLRDWEIEKQ